MFTSETLVQNIRRQIEQKGYKQKAIAERIGKTQQEFSNMLNFRKKISTEDVLYIAQALDVDVNELYRTDDADKKGEA